MIAKRTYQLLTMDLDDTLWPCEPVILRAEAVLYAWLERIAPRLTDACDQEQLRHHRRMLMMSRPEIAHDITEVRRLSLRELLAKYGYAASLADDAMALFLDQRNRVEPYADVIPALRTLGAEHRLVSVTNGNADLARTPLGGLFHLSLTAADVGAQKPDPALFRGALDWCGVTPEAALHLGDDPYRDVEAARNLGMEAVWINRGDGIWPDELDPPAAELGNLSQLQRLLRDRRSAL